MKKIFTWPAVIVAFFLLAAFSFWAKDEESVKPVLPILKTVKIGEVVLDIEVADTETERIKGLSEKEILEENEGLLFVFDKGGYYGIWMKEMNFPIDIAWFDENKKITHIENAVSPETYPKVFNSFTPSLYILETNANFFVNHKIKIGDVAEF